MPGGAGACKRTTQLGGIQKVRGKRPVNRIGLDHSHNGDGSGSPFLSKSLFQRCNDLQRCSVCRWDYPLRPLGKSFSDGLGFPAEDDGVSWFIRFRVGSNSLLVLAGKSGRKSRQGKTYMSDEGIFCVPTGARDNLRKKNRHRATVGVICESRRRGAHDAKVAIQYEMPRRYPSPKCRIVSYCRVIAVFSHTNKNYSRDTPFDNRSMQSTISERSDSITRSHSVAVPASSKETRNLLFESVSISKSMPPVCHSNCTPP